MIYRKVYVSYASPSVTEADVQGILSASRRNNQADELSGLLMFHERKFFQVLEGPLDRLESCYERIEKDTRHERVRLLAKGTSPDRAFGDWKMGFVKPEELSAHSRTSVLELTALADKNNSDRGSNERVHGMIDNFLLSFGISDGNMQAAE